MFSNFSFAVKAFSKSLYLVALFCSQSIASADSSSDYQRIVSAGGSITEILYALGLGDRIVAVDSSSMYPPSTTKLPKVGYFRSLGAEGVLSLNPDLVVTARGAGPENVLLQIQNAGVPVKTFEQSVYTKESWKALISNIGALFNKENESSNLIGKVEQNIKNRLDELQKPTNQINAIALLNSGDRGTTLAGKNTMPDFLFSLLGVNNLADDLEGFKPFSPEALAASDIDLILVPAHNLKAMGGIEGICSLQAISYATKGKCNVVVMDPLLLLGFGARIDQAVDKLVDQINSLTI